VQKSVADIANAQANVLVAQDNTQKAHLAVVDAQSKLGRRIQLANEGVLSKEDRETAQATYDQAVSGESAAHGQGDASQAALSASRAEQQIARMQESAAQAQVKQALASLAQAQIDLDHTYIKAPVDGTVVSRQVNVGQTVAASLSAPIIFEIAQDLAKMQVDTNVDEADVGRVQVGQRATFTVDAYPNRVFRGAVTAVRQAPINVQNVVTYDTVIGVSNPELKLKPGMTANVSIIVAHKDDVLQIKNAALRYRPPDATPVETRSTSSGSGPRPSSGRFAGSRSGGTRERQIERTVYALPNGASHPEPVQIKTGISDGVATEVAEGLKEGDRVVTAELTPTANAPSPPANPFGGGPRRFP